MNNNTFLYFAIAALLLGIGGAIDSFLTQTDFEEKCTAKGGVTIVTNAGYMCLDPKALK